MASPKGTCTLMTFSCHVGLTSSFAARRPSTPRWRWTFTWTPLLWDMGTPLIHVVRYWCPVLVRMGVRLEWAALVLRACFCHSMASGSHLAMTGTSCRSGALAASYRAPGSLRDMRLTSALVTSWVCALVAPRGPLARRCSSHCPRAQFEVDRCRHPLLLGYIRLLQPCLWHVTCADGARWYLVGGYAELYRALVVVFDLGTLLYSCSSFFSKIPNPKSTNLCAGSLDGAPIHRHFTNSKTKTLSRDRSIIQHFIHTTGIPCFLCIHRLHCHCDCNSRARCAAAVRSHNTIPP